MLIKLPDTALLTKYFTYISSNYTQGLLINFSDQINFIYYAKNKTNALIQVDNLTKILILPTFILV